MADDNGDGTRPRRSSDVDRHTEFVGQKGFFFAYGVILLITRMLVGVVLHYIGGGFGAELWSWTVVSALHAAGTFYFFHWVKGAPFWHEQGRYDRLTFWEQIDRGRQYTFNRKVLTLIPVILGVLGAKVLDWDRTPLLINFALLCWSIIPKFGWMYRVRIAHINE